MNDLKKLLKKYNGDKKAVAELLEISVRYIDMILSGKRKAGKHLAKYIKLFI